MFYKAIVYFAAGVFIFYCCTSSYEIKKDFSTPEGAILCLENAYRNIDIEAAVSAKNFIAEAYYMLKREMPNGGSILGFQDEIVIETAEVLELAYRKELLEIGFPNFQNVKSSFLTSKDIGEGYFIVREKCVHENGNTTIQDLVVFYDGKEYKVLAPTEDKGF